MGSSDWFVQVKVTVQDSRATMIHNDGNGLEHARTQQGKLLTPHLAGLRAGEVALLSWTGDVNINGQVREENRALTFSQSSRCEQLDSSELICHLFQA